MKKHYLSGLLLFTFGLIIFNQEAKAQLTAYSFGKTDTTFRTANALLIATSGNHTLVGNSSIVTEILRTGWGSNDYDQIKYFKTNENGFPSTSSPAFEDRHASYPNLDLQVGEFHSLHLKGNVITQWGDNSRGQGTVPASLHDNAVAIAAGGYHNLAINKEGLVVAWGDNTYGQTDVPEDLGKVKAIAAGKYHSLAIKEDGTVVAWGDNSYQKATVPNGLTAKLIAAGDNHSVAVKQDGTIVAWGDNTYGQTDVPEGLSNIVDIDAGANHTIVAFDGSKSYFIDYPNYGPQDFDHNGYKASLTGWGDNSEGQLNFPTDLKDVIAVGAGGNSTVFLNYPCGNWQVSPETLPDGNVGETYPKGPGTHLGSGVWLENRFSSYDLPQGVTLSPFGNFSGSPVAAGDYEFKIISGDYFCYAQRQYSITVSPWSVEPTPNIDTELRDDFTIEEGEDMEVKSLSVASNATLTVPNGSSLIVNGDLASNGDIVVDDGASLVMKSNSASASGTITVKKEGWSTSKYNYMGIPVKTAPISSLGNYVYSYDEGKEYGEARWVSPGEELQAGKGYTSVNTGVATFEGTLNTGPIDVTISRSEAGDDGVEGWNLIANPYAAAISFSDFIAANNTELNNFIYLWDESGDDGEFTNDDYLIYDSDGFATKGNGASFDGNINSCQGFFVQKTNDGSGKVTFNNSMQVEGNNNHLLRVAENEKPPYIKLQATTASGVSNEVLIKFKEEATLGYDHDFDAYKLKGNSYLSFYSKIGEEDFIIQSVPEAESVQIDLGLDLTQSEEVTFSIVESNILNVKDIVFEDKTEGKYTKLNDENYHTYVTQGEDIQRFALRIGNDVVTSVKDHSATSIKIYSNGGQLLLNDAEAIEKEVTLFNLLGEEVYSFSYSGSGKKAFDVPLTGSVYLVKVRSAKGTETEKVYISK